MYLNTRKFYDSITGHTIDWKSLFVHNINNRTNRQVWGAWTCGPAYLTFCSSRVSLVNSSMSAAVPTNIRRSWESWSRVIPPPMGRSHLPIMSINKNVWWSPKVQTFSHTVDKLFTKTLAYVAKMSYREKFVSYHLGEIRLLHHGFQSRVSFCGRSFSENDSSLTKKNKTPFNWTLWGKEKLTWSLKRGSLIPRSNLNPTLASRIVAFDI